MDKKELRHHILQLRSRLSEDDRCQKSKAIGVQLFSLPEFQQAACILFFAGFGSEVETLCMIDQALLQGKQVVVPKVIRKRRQLELRRLSDPRRQLGPGAMGILEPDETCPLVELEGIDLIIVPAVAWDETGHRLGYGGGFYDRLLATATCPTIGIGFDCQLVEEVPRAEHDLGVDILITETRLLYFRK